MHNDSRRNVKMSKFSDSSFLFVRRLLFSYVSYIEESFGEIHFEEDYINLFIFIIRK